MARNVTTTNVSEMRGCHTSSVCRIANKRGIGKKLGHAWFFTPAEAKRICKLIHDGPGRPKTRKP